MYGEPGSSMQEPGSQQKNQFSLKKMNWEPGSSPGVTGSQQPRMFLFWFLYQEPGSSHVGTGSCDLQNQNYAVLTALCIPIQFLSIPHEPNIQTQYNCTIQQQ